MADISYEDPEATFFCTSRTIASRLWFINNRKLHRKIAAFLAKYQNKYGVITSEYLDARIALGRWRRRL